MRRLGWIAVTVFCLGHRPEISLAQMGTNTPQAGDFPAPLQLGKIIQGPPTNDLTWEALKGKLVVLEFWNTQCKPCIEAIPHLNEMVEHFKGKPVVFLSVSDDAEDRLRAFLKQHPLRSWLALDGPDNATERGFHLKGYGLIVLIDPEGKVVGLTLSSILEQKHLDRILAGGNAGLPTLKFLPASEPQTNSVGVPEEKPK
jgi:thiol-disulfide isomerase/thioredoxin